MQSTRRQILDHLHSAHRGTVKQLAGPLGLTPTGVRQHLAVLEREGLVSADCDRGHVGRPAFVYRLTEAGEALYPKPYDVLVNMLMEEIRQVAGAEVLQRILRRVAGRMAEENRGQYRYVKEEDL